MSAVPAFDVGVWNAWILMLYLPLHPLMFIVIDRLVGVGNIVKKLGNVPYDKTGEKVLTSSMILFLLAFIYSIFLPLKLGSIWLYAGIAIYALGLVMFIIAMVNIVTTPHDQPFTKGLYRYSRHPMTFWGNLMHLGISIATASWIFILFSIVYAILWHILVITEERGCLEKYGDAYQKYLQSTPRWIGIPKST
ncbi:MAG: isoprenylcysteine carboxylmethyltransferase family protein [Dehalococcoidia bacterium]|nr:MAG: isoprenylcysteine carboxylmethyltransferase family protein [Dehalococcoidia bacterium]